MIGKIIAIYCAISYGATTIFIYRGFKLQPELFAPVKPMIILLFLFAPITFPFMVYGGIKNKLAK